MNELVRKRIVDDLRLSREWEFEGRVDAAWAALEEAHVLSQRWAVAHIRAHWSMLGLAWRQRDSRERGGQFIRLVVAGPGSVAGRYPAGNSGRAAVPMTLPMPITPDLAALLERTS